MRKVVTLTGKNLPKLSVAKPGWPERSINNHSEVERTDYAAQVIDLDFGDEVLCAFDYIPENHRLNQVIMKRALERARSSKSDITPKALSDFTRVCDQTGLSERLRKDS